MSLQKCIAAERTLFRSAAMFSSGVSGSLPCLKSINDDIGPKDQMIVHPVGPDDSGRVNPQTL